MNRRKFLGLLGAAAGSAALKGCLESRILSPDSGKRMNVVVVLTDDQRYQFLGCTGHPFIQTPHIDKLASEGVLFRNAFVTSAACTPSRTSYLTGQYERRHGINFNSGSSLSEAAFDRTYPMLLKQNGYFTGYVGKNHTPAGAGGYTSGLMERRFDYWYANHKHSTFYPKDRFDIYNNSAADTQVEIFEEGSLNFLEPREAFIQGAREFLRFRPKDRPFCLCVNFNVPHSAGTGTMKLKPEDPDLYKTEYRDVQDEIEMPRNYLSAEEIAEPKIPHEVYNGQYIPSYDYVKTPEGLREQVVRECQTVTGVDGFVGKLRQSLRDSGLDQDTIIIFSSDHGIMHGEYGLGGKVLLYDPSIHVPLIVYDPRLPARLRGTCNDELVLSVDIAPTIMTLCGFPAADTMQGKSLQPLIYGRKTKWRDAFFCENLYTQQNYPRIEAIRTKEWKYIRYFYRHPEIDTPNITNKKLYEIYSESRLSTTNGEEPAFEELFHLKSDPDENRNLASDPACASTLRLLRTRLDEEIQKAVGVYPLDTLILT